MKKVTLIVFAIFLAGIVVAQESPSIIGEVDYYNATRYAGGRNCARTPAGDLVVVFEPAAGYTNQDIWYYTYNSIFSSWDAPAQLSQSTTNDAGTPAVIADESGKIYAVWKELLEDGRRHAMFSIWEDGLWSTPTVAESDTFFNNAGVMTVDIASDGTIFNLFSIWNDPPEFKANIYSSHSNDSGETWVTDNLTKEFPTPDELPINYLDVNLAPGKNGTMFAVWEDKFPETNAYEIFMSIYKPGAGWSTPEAQTPVYDGEPRTLKYLDGCTPVAGAESVYLLGNAEYQHHEKSAAIDYKLANNSQVLSSFFNFYYIDPVEKKNELVADVLNYFGMTAASKILLVDDDNRYNNENLMTDALDLTGLPYSVFDCGNSNGMATNIPPVDTLQLYNLVIWFAGDDGKDDALWNAADGDNQAIMDYLKLGNKKMWIIGSDWLYDRYGSAPDVFQSGDMVYDYFGIASYDVQTYSDDGNLGVAWLTLADGSTVSDVNPIGWGSTGGTRQGVPSIATDPSGDLHIAYLDEKVNHIMYSKYDGENWQEAVVLDTSGGYLDRPNIAIDPNYGVYVTWMGKIDAAKNVFYNTSPDGGQTWNVQQQLSQATNINSSGNTIFYPTIGKKVRRTIEGVFKGGADVVWTEYNPSSSMEHYLMYARIPYVGTLTPPTMSVLLVDDDNYSNPDHLGRIQTAITDAGFSYTLFAAQDSAASPTAKYLHNFDLVLWYTANDGAGHYFWAGADTLNTELKSYLDNGGMIWAMGNDFIYDKYKGAPDTLAPGEFLYDYFGIASYDVQSKVDDGGIGVPQLDLVAGQDICQLDTINWYISGLWYGDGCTPVTGAVPVYQMGPASYALAGNVAAIYYDNGVSKAFSCYFDPYYFDSAENRATFFSQVLNWFQNQTVTSVNKPADNAGISQKYILLQNYPNPFNPATTIAFEIAKDANVKLSIYDILGKRVATLIDGQMKAGFYTKQWNAQSFASGVYIVRLTAGDVTKTNKIMLMK